MTTIHSLPTELVHAILTYAYPYPHHLHGDRLGMRLACLVHPTWRPLGQAALTRVMHFHHSNQEKLRQFVDFGPRGFECRRLRFAGTAADLVELVARASAGGIAALVLEAGLSEELFGMTGLNDLRWLRFETDFSPSEMNLDCSSDWTWPTRLEHLSIDKAAYPPSLISASAPTLNSLQLRWTSPDQLPRVLAAVAHLRHLRHLALHEAFGSLAGTPDAHVPPDLLALVNVFPRLSHLSLTSIFPAQLADILDALVAPPEALSTSILTAEVEEADVEYTYDQDQAGHFMSMLARCARSGGLAGVWRWEFAVLDDSQGWIEDLTEKLMDGLFGEDMMNQAEGWNEFKKLVKGRGVRLECGKWDDDVEA